MKREEELDSSYWWEGPEVWAPHFECRIHLTTLVPKKNDGLRPLQSVGKD